MPAGRKGKAETAMAADSEAEEESDEVPLQTDSDEAFEEAGADNTSYVLIHYLSHVAHMFLCIGTMTALLRTSWSSGMFGSG